MQGYKTIEDLGDLNGKVAMLRADLNVPMDEIQLVLIVQYQQLRN